MPGNAEPVVVRTDVSGLTGITDAFTLSSVFLPDPAGLPDTPVVVFGFPGGGYARGYFAIEMPGSSDGGQARYHAREHGWIFIACDHLGVGDSKIANEGDLTNAQVNAANRATVGNVLHLLAQGQLAKGFPPIGQALKIGMGQSMGGCLTVSLQGTSPTFDAIAVLGFSAIHTAPRSGRPPSTQNDQDTYIDSIRQRSASGMFRKGFHWPDVPEEIVLADLTDFPTRNGKLPPWASATIPGCARAHLTPGIIAREAEAIETPVFIGAGEIDLLPDPKAEPSAYARSPAVTVKVIPRMAHMHNFASTRTLLWDSLASWVGAISS